MTSSIINSFVIKSSPIIFTINTYRPTHFVEAASKPYANPIFERLISLPATLVHVVSREDG